jgi:hypothetical protein
MLPMVCVPIDISFLLHVAEQEVVLAHVARELPSAVIVIDAMLVVASVAGVAILTLPFCVLPFVGELIVTFGELGEGVVGVGVLVVEVMPNPARI